MAAKFPSASKVPLRDRKGHDRAWSCDKHDEPIKFFCKEHRIPICHPCATKDHVKKQCELDDIEDVIFEMRRKLEEKLPELDEMMRCFKKLNSEIQSCSAVVRNHLKTVNDELNMEYDDKIKTVKDKEREEIRLISEEAEEEIRIIKEKRDRRVKSSRAGSERQQRSIEDTRKRHLSDCKEIDLTVGKKITNLTNKNQHRIETVESIGSMIKYIKQDDKTLVNETPQVIASIHETAHTDVIQDISDSLDHLKCEVQKVKLVEGNLGGEHGFIGKWELVKSIDIPLIIKSPRVHGLISDDEICVSDGQDDVYVTHISNEHTHKVIEDDHNMCVISCAPVDSNLIVCGKWRRDCKGESLDGCITLYDRQWKVVRDITIPRNTPLTNSSVSVDVDRDGMILAAQHGQSNIYVINPADGKIVNTIKMQGKVVWGEIQALSSGEIVVNTCLSELTVISRSGEKKAVIHSVRVEYARCHVDKLTDILYMAHLDAERDILAVDQVSRYGNYQARSIVEHIKASDRGRYFSPCLFTSSGNLITCNGDNIFVYKKIFDV